MLRRSIVALVLVMIAGCGAGVERVGYGPCEPLPQRTVRGDTAFTAEERLTIEASNEWIARHIGVTPVRIVWDAPHSEVDDESVPGLVRRTYPHLGGFCDSSTGRIYIGIGGNPLAALAAHELGHFYGLRYHTTVDDDSVMNYKPSLLYWSTQEQIMTQWVPDRCPSTETANN
jgi:hypothetical protein